MGGEERYELHVSHRNQAAIPGTTVFNPATPYLKTWNYRSEYADESGATVAVNELYRQDGELPTPEEPEAAESVAQQHQEDLRYWNVWVRTGVDRR